jgi:hypothetical protein
MLVVGNPGINDTEGRAHFSMWAIMAAIASLFVSIVRVAALMPAPEPPSPADGEHPITANENGNPRATTLQRLGAGQRTHVEVCRSAALLATKNEKSPRMTDDAEI